MSVIYGNPIITNGGGVKLNIDYGSTPPTDTTKLWVPLTKKPDAVECSPVLNYGSEYLTYNSEPPVRTTNSAILGYFGEDLLIYYGGRNQPMYSFNSKSKEYTKLNVNTPLWVNGGGAAYGRNLYTFGGYTGSDGYTNRITKFNVDTNELTTLSGVVLPWSAEDVGTAVIGDKIYLIGGISNYTNPWIAVFDPLLETIVKLSVQFDYNKNPYGAFAIASVGKIVYLFGGRTLDSQNSNMIQKFDTATNTLSILKVSVPSAIGANYPAVAFPFGKNIYVFGSYDQTVYRFDTESETITKLSYKLPKPISGAGAAVVGSTGFIIGAYEAAVSSLEFVVETPLTSNHLFLQEDYGYDDLWTALKSKDTDLKVKVINAYLGDSNNIAQLTNAYLYDTSSNQWKSLSGESYVADMQNALNILGVN